jgi:HAD superfamily hydrolase (TIGR01490 family)
MKKVAFFDIDGTVFRSSLLIELVLELIKQGHFPSHVQGHYEHAYRAWKNRTGTYSDYIHAVVDTFVQNIKGVHYGDLADVGREVVAVQGQEVYRYTRDLIADLKHEGYFLVAISQSPKTVVDAFARGYGFDKVYGRIYEIGPQDRFTGEMLDAHLIEDKGKIVARVAEKEAVTLEDSIGVGDTESDISLLECVFEPICFNPNKQLFEAAKVRDWKVVVERKDVIYEL